MHRTISIYDNIYIRLFSNCVRGWGCCVCVRGGGGACYEKTALCTPYHEKNSGRMLLEKAQISLRIRTIISVCLEI